MKKIIFFTLFVLMISSVFAFEVLNSNDVVQTYFSITNDNVKVKASSSATILTVDYAGSSPRSQIYPFGACGSDKCVSFDLTDLVNSNNDSLTDSIEFTLDVNGTTSKIYLDTKSPEFNLTSSTVDSVNKKINFAFTYSDDKEIAFVKLYEKVGSSENFIANISSNSYVFTGVSKSVYEFIFKLEDKAGNKKEFSKVVNVGDLSNPVITEAFLIKQDDDSFELSLKLSDNEGLDRYEITQGNINLNEDISGTSYSKTIKTPFTSGTVVLKVLDNKGNSVSKTLDLSTKISNSYGSVYSDSRYFKLTSNADKCVLDEVDGKSENDEFDKSSDDFKVKVNAPSNEKIEISFYCEKSGFRQFFIKDFFYDNEEPSSSNLSIEKTNDGFLKLFWTKAEDVQSDVDYTLYRDENKIYSGSKLEFIDQKVIYPSEYNYYLKIADEAGNSVKSNIVKGVPNKVKVLFELDDTFETKVKNSSFNFIFETEKNIDVTLRIENNGKEIANQKFKTTSEKVNVNLQLAKGQNLIHLDLADSFGNKNSQEFYVIFEPVVLVQNTVPVTPVTKVESKPIVPQEKVITETKNETVVPSDVDNSSAYSGWIWFAIILAAFVYFIWFFVINEDALRIKDRYRARKNRSVLDKKRRYDTSFFTLKRSKDNVLAKDFERIKRERILRQEEKKFEDLQNKKLQEKQVQRTILEQRKLDDLGIGRKPEIAIPFSERIRAKRRVNKIKKEINYEDELASSKSKIEKPKTSFFSFFSKTPTKIPSEMDNYLSKTTQNKGWKSTSEYVFKPEPQIKIEEPKEDLTGLTSKKVQEEQLAQESKKGFFGKFKKEKEFVSSENKATLEPVKTDKKVHLDDYLSNIGKKKKRKSFYFAEKSVDQDLSER